MILIQEIHWKFLRIPAILEWLGNFVRFDRAPSVAHNPACYAFAVVFTPSLDMKSEVSLRIS